MRGYSKKFTAMLMVVVMAVLLSFNYGMVTNAENEKKANANKEYATPTDGMRGKSEILELAAASVTLTPENLEQTFQS